jgi:putative transposase
MLLSFKTELNPNNKQVTLFRQHCGVARHAYNFGNAAIQEALLLRETDKTIKIPSAIDLHKRLVAEIKPANPWYYQSSKASPQQALAEVRTAWDSVLKKYQSSLDSRKKGSPKTAFILNKEPKQNQVSLMMGNA